MASLIDRVRWSRSVRRLSDQRGAELLEFALVMPLLLVLTAGIIDFGLLFRDYEVVTNAAREGARVAVLPGYTDADAVARANAYLVASGLTPTDTPTVVPVPIPAGGAGAPTFPGFQVTVQYDHQMLMLGPLMGLLGGSFPTSLTVTGTSVMRGETSAAGP